MPRGMAQTRREFLERTAYGAGLAGMSALWPASTILAEAAEPRLHLGSAAPVLEALALRPMNPLFL